MAVQLACDIVRGGGKLPVIIRILASAALTVAFVACGSEPDATVTACENGVMKACTCDDGSKSTQTCTAGKYAACDCQQMQADTGADGTVEDAAQLDTVAADSVAPDAAGADSGLPDSSIPDTTATDATVADSTDPDAAQVDTQGDAGAADAVADTSDATSGPVACASDKDCKDAGKVCDPLTKQCVACLTDAECATSQHCVSYLCQAYTLCTNSLGCKAAKGPDGNDQPICDQKIGECSACLTSADCPASNDCKGKQCVPYKTCQNSTECSKDEVCDKAQNRCVQCLGDNDCAANQLCEQGKCNSFIPCSSDKQCTDKGLLCDQAKGKCTQCLQNSDCPGIYNCQNTGVAKTGICVLDVCAQGQGACSNNQKVTCNQVGDGYGSPAACPAQTTCVAPGGKPDCKAWVCTPGSNCQGDKAVECSADGLEIVKSTDCAASAEKCFDGVCKALICKPTEAFCDGNTVKLCDDKGLTSSTQKTCGGTEFCDAGTCKAQICTPGGSVCGGNTATTCNANGSGYVAGGSDCGSDKCIAGVCKKQVCQPATPFCDGANLMNCSPDGLSATLNKACGIAYYCGLTKAGDAGCLPVQCDPGKPTCDGKVATTCKADGSGYAAGGVDCSAAGKVCSAGACVALKCDPQNPLYCDGNIAMKCDGTGLSPSTLQTCGATQYCDKGVCQAQICTPNAAGCNGQAAATCNANGSGYLAGGTDCKAAGKVCSAGACVAQVCDPLNPLYCDGNVAKKCDATGLSPSTLQTCGATQYCDKGTCQAQMCTPNAAGCNGQVAATCNANGSGYLAGGTDCKAAGKTCSAGICVAQVCGNGVVEGTEECDAANMNGTSACSATCTSTCSAGGDATISLPAAPMTTNMTIEMWLKYSTAMYNSHYTYLWRAFFNAGCAAGVGSLNFNDGLLSLHGSAPGTLIKVAAPTADAWHHVAAQFGPNSTKLFIDGKLAGSIAVGAGTVANCAAKLNVWDGVGAQPAGLQFDSVRMSKTQRYPDAGFVPGLLTVDADTLISLAFTEGVGTSVANGGSLGASATFDNAGKWTKDCAPLMQVCTANAPSCLGNLAGTCNALGTGLVSATDCAVAGKSCSAGACVAQVCDPLNPLYCDGNVAKKCDATGLSPSTLQTCGATQYCDNGTCQAQVCTPNAAGCNGTVAATCNANGSGYLSGGTDCAAAGKSCAAGACITQVCGNGKLEGLEQCDDGNVKDGDGCSASCSCGADGALKVAGSTCTDTGCGANGKNQMAVLPVSAGMAGLSAATVEVWVRPDATSQYGNLFGTATAGAPAIGYYGDIGYGSNAKKFAASWAGGATIWTTAKPTLGTWYHVALVFDGIQVRFYFNGILQGQANATMTALPSVDPAQPIYIGGNPSAGNGNSNLQFNGAYRSLRISKKALYTKDFLPETTLTVTADTLQFFGFDETSGTKAQDSASASTGDLLNGATWTSTGPFSPCNTSANPVVCGNGVKEVGEGCDDGNIVAGDGCSATCQVETAWTLVRSEPLTTVPTGAIAENSGYSGQGVGQIGGRTAWVMNSDWNGFFVPDNLSATAKGWAVELEMWRPAADRGASFGIRTTHAWQGGANVQAGAGCGEDGTNNVGCTQTKNWVGTWLGKNLAPSATGVWRKYRIEYEKSTGKMTSWVDGNLVGSWAIDPAILTGTYVGIGASSPCCQATQVGFSNLKTYQIN